MAQTANSSHFARILAGQHCALDAALGFTASTMRSAPARGMHASAPAKAAIGLPTLGDTGLKLNSSRWTQCGAQEGASIFDVKGAMETLQKGPDAAGKKRAHPAAIAHAERVARAQQMGYSVYGFKLFPDLTPGRAFMWGSILAVYTVGAATLLTARQLDINSVGDVKEKMTAFFAPYKEAMKNVGQTAVANMKPTEQSATIASMQQIGRSVKYTLSGKTEEVEM